MGIKFNQKVSFLPGPTCYNGSKPLSKGSSHHFAVSKRHEMSINNGPGPAAYNTPKKSIGSNTKSFSFTGKPKHKYNVNPGPGHYKPVGFFDISPKLTFGRAKG